MKPWRCPTCRHRNVAYNGICTKCGRNRDVDAAPKHKASHIGAPAVFALHQCGQQLRDAYGSFGPYVVGSALQKPDWRDVDVRYILEDAEFLKLFPDTQMHGAWEFDPRWLLMSVSISAWMKALTGLPIDFQFQPQSWANSHHKGPRHPIGIRFAPRGSLEASQ